jgi:LDH2 family malate/lactate/ureidoglycolate dehydrogenase
MQEIAEGRVRLGVEEATDLGTQACVRIGYAPEDARVIANHVVDAALCGYEYSGLAKILNIIDSRKFANPRTPITTLRETGVSLMLDGGNNVGMLALYRAAEAAIRKAETHGMALVGINNTWMSGRSAHYVELIGRAGLVAIHSVSASHQVAPHGGARPTMGTNPIAFAFPADPDPLVIDMGTSAFMGTDLKFRQRLGIPLPEGVAIDAQGLPTRDATAAQLGAILPFGGHKGFALALAMDALGVMAGSGYRPDKTDAYIFVVMKPDLLMPMADFKQHLAETIARIKATPLQPGFDEIRIPSERAYRERRRLLVAGIDIDRRIHDALKTIAEQGLPPGKGPAAA